MRGTSSEDSRYFVDGVPIPLVHHFGNTQSVLASEMIEDIEFIPGGFGVEHGRSTGAVFDISTRRSELEEWKGLAELSFINLAAYAQGPLSREHNVSAAISFRRSIVDVLLPYVVPDDVNLTFTQPPQYYDGHLRIDWSPSYRHHISISAIGI